MAKKKTVEAPASSLKEFDGGVTIEYVVKDSLQEMKDGTVQLDVKFAHIPEVIPFLAHPEDTMEYGRWLHEQAAAGALGDVNPWERPLPTVDDLQEELDKIWPDVVLGIATEDELSLAKALRIQIKSMQ